MTDDNEDEILINIIWIFGNLLGEDEEMVKSISEKIPLHSKILKIFSRNSLNRELRTILLFCYKNMIKNITYDETYLMDFHKIIIKIIIENYINDKYAINDDILIEALEVFEETTKDGNEYLITAMYDVQLFQTLMAIIENYQNFDTKIINLALIIIGNSFICENRELNTVI